jgi:DNA adenine methylase
MIRLMRYPGGKGKAFAHIINEMPPHERYIESHLGGGAVIRNKLPAKANIGIEIDPNVVAKWHNSKEVHSLAFEIFAGDALRTLQSLKLRSTDMVYMDPPYLPSTRKRCRVYPHDLSETEHIRLLSFAKTAPAMIIISGYRSALYDDILAEWRRVDFVVGSHSGARTESIWMNYQSPRSLHDSRYLGGDYRQRQDIKRRTERLKQRIERLQPIEKSALLNWLHSSITSENENGPAQTA